MTPFAWGSIIAGECDDVLRERSRIRAVSSRCNVRDEPRLLSFCHAKFGVVLLIAGGLFVERWSAVLAIAQSIDLATSKQLIEPVPGNPQRLNSLPMSMAVSPDGRYVVTVNAGYGTYESKYEQSLAVLDTQTGTVADFPDDRTAGARASRRSIPGWRSAATGGISTPASDR